MKKILLLFSLLISFSLCAEDISVKPAGEGTAESPYFFDRLENFFWLRDNILDMDSNVPVYCKQTKDIDASATQKGGDYAWQTIEFKDHLFVYDGQCYTIYGLEPEEQGALFGKGYLQLKNIRIHGAEGKKTCGLAKGLYSSSIKNGYLENCHIKGLLVGMPALATTVFGSGIVINGCIVEADIEELKNGALISECRLFEKNIIKNTCFKGKIKPTTSTALLSGLANGITLDIISNTEVTIEDCYFNFDIESNPGARYAVGGLIFDVIMFRNTNVVLNIERCYVSGTTDERLENGQAFIYNLTNIVNTINVKDSFYNETLNLTDKYATLKTEEEMKQKATFKNWDFENIWDIDEGEGMPYLRCEIPEPMGLMILLLLAFLKSRER